MFSQLFLSLVNLALSISSLVQGQQTADKNAESDAALREEFLAEEQKRRLRAEFEAKKKP